MSPFWPENLYVVSLTARETGLLHSKMSTGCVYLDLQCQGTGLPGSKPGVRSCLSSTVITYFVLDGWVLIGLHWMPNGGPHVAVCPRSFLLFQKKSTPPERRFPSFQCHCSKQAFYTILSGRGACSPWNFGYGALSFCLALASEYKCVM